MNMPVIRSTPGRSDGRPDTVAPSTTSASPLCRASTSAHAACTRVFSVSWWRLTNASTSTVEAADRRMDFSAWSCACSFAWAARSSYGSGVGACSPASSRFQNASIRDASCRWSQPMNSRYGTARSVGTASPWSSAR
ncbi:hypothetical protein COSO111634_19365 [Corallococcus soli]